MLSVATVPVITMQSRSLEWEEAVVNCKTKNSHSSKCFPFKQMISEGAESHTSTDLIFMAYRKDSPLI